MSTINLMRKEVMLIGHKLRKAGYTLSKALKIAWAMVKKAIIKTNVAGVTYGNRQKALEHLKRYSKEQIKLQLVRENKNPYDSNAVAIWVNVLGKVYKIGYLNKTIAKAISILIDKGLQVAAKFEAVVGGPLEDINLNYGLSITLQLI